MSATLILTALALQSAPPLENLEALRQSMEAVAEAPIRPLDPRLRLPACPQAVDVAAGPRSIVATCAVVGWRVHGVPMQSTSGSGGAASAAQAGPAIRRGDPVTLRVPGRGFAVAMRAIALEDAAVGARIRLRRASGPTTPLIGIVTAPGEAQPAG